MKLAVAIDGSENAIRAAQHAIFLAKHLPDATLEVIYVADVKKAADDRFHAQSPESLQLKRTQKVQKIVKLAKEQQVTVTSMILKGDPSTTLIDHVNTNHFDGLIVGSRGLNTFQEMILGSVSHKLMKHVQCPVTIVK